MAMQVLHEYIKELLEEMKILIIWRQKGESHKHLDKEQLEARASSCSTQLKDENTAMPYVSSSREELEESFDDMDKGQVKITLAPISEQKTHTLMPCIPPHRRFRESYVKKDKNHHLKYKTQKTMPNHNHCSKYKTQNKMQNHAQVPEICCSFIQGMEMSHINCLAYTNIKSVKMTREAPKQSRIVSLAHNPNQSQGHDNKYNNTNNETKVVEDCDKAQSIEDQNEPGEKMFENKNDKRIYAFDDNPDVNANYKEDGDLINCNNETPNVDEDINVLQVVATQNVRDQTVPKEQ